MKKSFILILIITTILGCTEEIDLELDETYTRLVVDGQINTDSIKHKVTLTLTTSLFYEQEQPTVSGAVLKVKQINPKNGENKTFSFSESKEKGVYLSDLAFKGRINYNYELTIENIDVDKDGKKESYFAKSYIAPISPIDSITVSWFDRGFDFKGYNVGLYAIEPAQTADFYVFRTFVNRIPSDENITDLAITDDLLFNGNPTMGVTVQYLDTSKKRNKLMVGDTVLLEMYRVTEEYYNFLRKIQLESFGSIPLISGPPANIKGNLTGGALGFFTTYSISRKNKIMTEKEVKQ